MGQTERQLHTVHEVRRDRDIQRQPFAPQQEHNPLRQRLKNWLRTPLRGGTDNPRSTLITLGSVLALNLPALISKLDPGTHFAALQNIFPFNMAPIYMYKHLTCSGANLSEGRYYTAVTHMFHHADYHHLESNMGLIFLTGYKVHVMFGRAAFLALFFGGGIAGSVGAYLEYISSRGGFTNSYGLPDAVREYVPFGDKIDGFFTSALSSSFKYVNFYQGMIGASAGAAAILGFRACSCVQYLVNALCGEGGDINVNVVVEHTLVLSQAVLMLWDDLSIVIAKYFACHQPAAVSGISERLSAFSSDGVGHAAHVGGFVFGVACFVGFACYKSWKRKKSRIIQNGKINIKDS